MSQTLKNKVTLITGAGRGIGQATALKFAAQGACVVVNDIDAEPVEQVVEQIRSAGGEAVSCIGDITTPNFANYFINTALQEYKGIDIIINNAGYTWDNLVHKITDEQWYAMIDIHLTAPFRILRAAQPVISELVKIERASGIIRSRRVVNISSISGVFGNVGQANYAVAKAGVEGMTKTLAKEWGRYNVTVNCVAYGYISTRNAGMVVNSGTSHIDKRDIRAGTNLKLKSVMESAIPLGRGGTPEEAAGAVYIFCLPEADYISGQVLMCTGGLTGI